MSELVEEQLEGTSYQTGASLRLKKNGPPIVEQVPNIRHKFNVNVFFIRTVYGRKKQWKRLMNCWRVSWALGIMNWVSNISVLNQGAKVANIFFDFL